MYIKSHTETFGTFAFIEIVDNAPGVSKHVGGTTKIVG